MIRSSRRQQDVDDEQLDSMLRTNTVGNPFAIALCVLLGVIGLLVLAVV